MLGAFYGQLQPWGMIIINCERMNPAEVWKKVSVRSFVYAARADSKTVYVTTLRPEVESSGEGSSSCSISVWQVAEFPGVLNLSIRNLERRGLGRDPAVKSICSLCTIDCTQYCQIDFCLHRYADWRGALYGTNSVALWQRSWSYIRLQ